MSSGDVNLNMSQRATPAAQVPYRKEPSEVAISTTTVTTDSASPVVLYTPDSTAYAPQPTTSYPRYRRHYSSFYVGLGGGASIPTGPIRNGYNTGFTVAVPIGWDSPESPLGFRVDLGYTRLDARPTFRNGSLLIVGGTPIIASPATADPQVWSALANLKLRVPFFGSFFGPTSGIYAVGGGGVNHFRHYNTTFALTNPQFDNTTTIPATNETMTRGALDAGGGISWAVGVTEVFLESRYVTTFMPNERASYVPIILGVNVR
jgi:hypothetical protein